LPLPIWACVFTLFSNLGSGVCLPPRLFFVFAPPQCPRCPHGFPPSNRKTSVLSNHCFFRFDLVLSPRCFALSWSFSGHGRTPLFFLHLLFPSAIAPCWSTALLVLPSPFLIYFKRALWPPSCFCFVTYCPFAFP